MASGRTPARSRPYPLESDSPDVASDMEALAMSVDAAPNATSGTLAQRPLSTAVALGDEYYATDSNQWFKSAGSSWGVMLVAGPWQPLTLPSGIIAASVADYPPSCRVEGDTVRLRGAIQNETGSTLEQGGALASVPSSCYPSSNAVLSASGATGGNSVAILLTIASGTGGDGEVELGVSGDGLPNGYYVGLDGLSYPLD